MARHWHNMIFRRSLVGFIFERVCRMSELLRNVLHSLNIHSEDVSTQIWSSGKARSVSPYLGGPFPRKEGFCPCRKETSSDFPGAGTHSRPDRWQRRHCVPDLSPRPVRLEKIVRREKGRTFQMAQTTGEAVGARRQSRISSYAGPVRDN